MTQLTLAPLTNFDVGAVASIAVALVAYRARTLSLGGALAAVAIGTATVGGLGAAGAGVLAAFFVPSIALSRLGRARKRSLLVDVDKTGPRDAMQVLANGGVAAVCALAAMHGDARFTAAFAGAFAAASSDTWGTEIGTLARGAPRSILTLRPVATGLSGGVTLAGTFAEMAGALCVGAAAALLDRRLVVLIAVAGFAGALTDSIAGASFQALRFCPSCRRPTEREPHVCGANTRRIRGFEGVGNDAVNFVATVAGAAVAYVFAPYVFSR